MVLPMHLNQEERIAQPGGEEQGLRKSFRGDRGALRAFYINQEQSVVPLWLGSLYFDNRSIHAAAASFNAKIKVFRRLFKKGGGLSDASALDAGATGGVKKKNTRFGGTGCFKLNRKYEKDHPQIHLYG